MCMTFRTHRSGCRAWQQELNQGIEIRREACLRCPSRTEPTVRYSWSTTAKQHGSQTTSSLVDSFVSLRSGRVACAARSFGMIRGSPAVCCRLRRAFRIRYLHLLSQIRGMCMQLAQMRRSFIASLLNTSGVGKIMAPRFEHA